MALSDPLPIRPFISPVRGHASVPGSKSLTNRALLLAALCDAPITLTGALFSEDTTLMAEALRRLGFTIDADTNAKTIRVSGQQNGFHVERAELFVGLAGTAARFLTALCAAAPRGVYRLDGVAQMRKRPMKGLIDALRALGADIRCLGEEGFFPVEIHARGLSGGPVKIDASESSQMLSALLMAAPLARSPVDVELVGGVRWPFVQMTARLMAHFGQPALDRQSEQRFRVSSGTRYSLPGGVYAIEPDASAASYFLALPLVTGGQLALTGLRAPGEGLQGDTQFAEVLRRVSAHIAFSEKGVEVSAASGSAPLRGVAEDFRTFSDTFLTLAAISPLLAGPTRITGIAHTRKQETDRVAGMARELSKLGQRVIETEDSLEIHPQPLTSGIEIETYHDHRFAMSFGILGCHDLRKNGIPWLSIKNPGCCAKTFPDFFDVLGQLWSQSHSH
jgi:3-phosphoshikimate 1-carboxyvinyltransferase